MIHIARPGVFKLCNIATSINVYKHTHTHADPNLCQSAKSAVMHPVADPHHDAW
jgi:hypothetical protein